MKFLNMHAAAGAAALFLSLPCEGKGGGGLHPLDVLHKRHAHSHAQTYKRLHASPRAEAVGEVGKRSAQCPFPTDAGLISVTPDQKNGGWAMSPDQCCEPGNYCPYACPPGQVMAQWDPKATSYTYPESMNGGLYCDNNGQISKPFPDSPYCVDGVGSVKAQNDCDDVVAFCQTVLPGNEAMLIPTSVMNIEQLAVPDTTYWCETAAHYYINPPGYTVEDACIWGSGDKAIGNWSPYVSGANTDGSGQTFVKVGWNPIWTGCDLSTTLPDFGVKVVCDSAGCNGLPCEIDPSKNGVNGVTSGQSATGAGGADFCVVTVPKGITAHIVVFAAGHPDSIVPSEVGPLSSSDEVAAPPSTPASAYPESSSQIQVSVASTSTTTSTTTTSTAAASSTEQPSASVFSAPALAPAPSSYAPGILDNNMETNTTANGVIANTKTAPINGSSPSNSVNPNTSPAIEVKNDAISSSSTTSIISIFLIAALAYLL